ncbi:SusC/RagA family TonB-linked outer membrane protein [Paraflavitalea pollutisoli]|uniref:SusC/RagA family TonB-linked outer membrane protein n=1 Tax=Paraflavitalea pollutisoli TaxID=3034143 RepID=UPI0023ED51B7|nr:TonB-dependent receptor [Paraflavitalea sp. H1-2-19X]
MKEKLPRWQGIAALLLFIAQLLLPGSTQAQESLSTVKGIVHGADNAPIPGASVVIRNTSSNFTSGTKTDSTGLFTASVPSGGPYRFTITTVGFQEQVLSGYNLKAGTIFTLDVSMKSTSLDLDQVIVIGYGSRKKSDVSSAIVSIDAEEIRSRPVQNALQALQGKAAGVDITSNERPGEAGGILIRGVRSLSATNAPLYVVDGVPLNFGGINAVNPNDIETINVLKDASATAVYGSRGANGVVLINTKKGKNGKISLDYVGTVTVEQLQDRTEMMNAAQYIEFRRDAYRRVKYLNPLAAANTTYPLVPTLADDQRIFGQDPLAWANVQKGWVNGQWDGSLVGTTDWTDLVTQTGVTQDHTISVSGGTQKVKTYASFGYLNQDGTQLGQDYTRYSAKFNIEINPVKWFTMGSVITASYGIQNFGFSTTNATGPGTIYAAAQGMLPYAIPYNENGQRINLPGGDVNILNPVGEENYNVNQRNTLRTLGAFHIELAPIKGLRYRLTFGPDFNNYKNGRYMDAKSINRGAGEPGSSNYAQLNQTQSFSWTLDNLLTYNTSIGGLHEIGATFLYSATAVRQETSSMTASKLPWDSQKWYQLGSVAALDNFSTGLTENSLLSYMGRVNYSYANKYFLDAYARWDGASPLAPGHKWDVFPAASIAWRIDQEKFMKTAGWLDQLKLRVGVGAVGNAAIGPYTTKGAVQTLYYSWGNIIEPGYVSSDPSSANPVTMPNQSLGWERTTQTDVGLEFSLLKGRISGSFDVYFSKTKDLLLTRSIPTLTGYTRTLDNIGVTSNQGLEVVLNTVNVQTRDFSWTSTINFATNRDRIVELSQGKIDDINNGWFIGKRLNVYYDYEKLGIWQDNEADKKEMDLFNANIAAVNSKFAPGMIKVKDQNGDYKIDANNDRVIVGNPQPKWNGGLINEFTYKNWSMNIFIFSRWGFTANTGAEVLQGRYAQRQLSYWTPTNASNVYPAPNYNSAAGDVYRTSMNYQDGSFVKVRNITLAYRLPNALATRFKMNNARIYAQVLNPGLLYSGIDWTDPDLGTSQFNRGVVVGVNVGF